MKLILFDLDGTLVEARDWHYQALNNALSLFGYNISRIEHETVFNGLPTNVKLGILKETQGFPINLYSIVSELKQEFTFKEIQENCKPQQNVVDTVRGLKERGFILGLCSNSIRKSVDLMLEKSEIKEYFDIILSNQDVQKSKPDPEIYLLAAQKLGALPQDCLVIEDNEKGVRAGEAAGMKVFKVDSPKDVILSNILREV